MQKYSVLSILPYILFSSQLKTEPLPSVNPLHSSNLSHRTHTLLIFVNVIVTEPHFSNSFTLHLVRFIVPFKIDQTLLAAYGYHNIPSTGGLYSFLLLDVDKFHSQPLSLLILTLATHDCLHIRLDAEGDHTLLSLQPQPISPVFQMFD